MKSGNPLIPNRVTLKKAKKGKLQKQKPHPREKPHPSEKVIIT